MAIALAQTLGYSHVSTNVAVTSTGQQYRIGLDNKLSDNWPTYHRDLSRSGYDPAIAPFSSASLNWKSVTLDGNVYAEPLVVGTAVVTATENNSLYELNAATGQVIWHVNLGRPVDGGLLPCGDINPSGITGTPVIDVSGRTIFAVAFEQAPNGTLYHELFAVDLDTGSIRYQLPIDPQTADPTVQQQRAALALSNGYIYVAYGGLDGDCGHYHGWLAATTTNGAGPVISYQVPTGRAGAIWGGGDGPAVDQSGDLLVATGNSDSTSVFDYGESVMKLSPVSNGNIALLDWFAPTNWAALNAADTDLGSTEPVILNSNLLFQIGKQGLGYVLNETNLGQFGGQLYSAQVCNGGGAYGGPAYSFPYLIVPCSNGLATVKVNLGSNPSFTVVWRGPSFVAGPPIIAGNAVWDVDVSHGLIYAFSLSSGQVLFHDSIGVTPTHFNSLSAGDGQIFVSASRRVSAYLPQQLAMSVTPQTPNDGTVSVGAYQTLIAKVTTNAGTVSVAGANVTMYINGAAICTNALSSTTGVVSCPFVVKAVGTYYWNATAEETGFESALAPQTTFTFTAGPAIFGIPLVTGWNLISIPLVPADPAIGNVLASQVAAGNLRVVWSYQNGIWRSSTFSGGKLSGSLTAMQDGFGYWIYMTEPDTLFVIGGIFAPPPATPPVYNLGVGWNLVGFKPQPKIQSESVNQYLSSLNGQYESSSVWVYDNPSNSWIRAYPAHVLQPGQAMWIFITVPTTLRP